MRYILKIPGRNPIEFPEYQDAMFSLSRLGYTDGMSLYEIDENDNVQSVITPDELQKIVAEIRAVIGGSVLTGQPGWTLGSDE